MIGDPSIPLPELFEAELDGAALAALLTDLGRAATIRAIRPRARRQALSEDDAAPAALPLAAIPAFLGAAAGRAVQITYQFDGAEWVDTLLRAADTGTPSTRLVRMRVLPPREVQA